MNSKTFPSFWCWNSSLIYFQEEVKGWGTPTRPSPPQISCRWSPWTGRHRWELGKHHMNLWITQFNFLNFFTSDVYQQTSSLSELWLMNLPLKSCVIWQPQTERCFSQNLSVNCQPPFPAANADSDRVQPTDGHQARPGRELQRSRRGRGSRWKSRGPVHHPLRRRRRPTDVSRLL